MTTTTENATPVLKPLLIKRKAKKTKKAVKPAAEILGDDQVESGVIRHKTRAKKLTKVEQAIREAAIELKQQAAVEAVQPAPLELGDAEIVMGPVTSTETSTDPIPDIWPKEKARFGLVRHSIQLGRRAVTLFVEEYEDPGIATRVLNFGFRNILGAVATGIVIATTVPVIVGGMVIRVSCDVAGSIIVAAVRAAAEEAYRIGKRSCEIVAYVIQYLSSMIAPPVFAV